VGGADVDPPTELDAGGRAFRGGLRAIELLARGLGVETWRGVDGERRPVVIKTLPVAAVSTAARHTLELRVDVLNQLAASDASGAGRAPPGVGSSVGAGASVAIDGDLLVVARPLVAGETLAERLAEGPLAPREAIDMAAGVLRAIEGAHGRGLVHGDLRPSNVVLAGGSPALPVVVDFELGRHVVAGERESLEDVPADAVRYLAPEQSGLLERGVDARADLHAVGLLLFEAVSGRAAIAGDTVSEVLRHHVDAAPPPPGSEVAGVPRALDRIAARLLRVDARDRYQTAAGARADLEELAAALERGDADPDLVVGARDTRDALTEPAFTGRAGELAALERALAGARAGRGDLVVLEGESGGGKTWILEELARRAGGAAWVLRGRGQAQVAGRPFQVLSALARAIAEAAPAGSARRDRIRARAGEVGRTIAGSLPALRGLLAAEAELAPAGPEPDAEERSLAALCDLLDALGAGEEPALLLIDDAQWADAPTLVLFDRWQSRAQARAGPSRHLLVVLAVRTDDETGEAPAASRFAQATRIRVAAFGPHEVREQVASMAGQLPARAVDLVIEHAAGNPFLVSALVQGMVESRALVRRPGGWHLTEDALAGLRDSGWLADLVAVWSARLSAGARRLLAVGALLGRRFDPVVAGELAGIDPGDAVRAVQPLRGALVWLDRDGASYSFPHDRIREALLDGISEAEKRRLHLEAARLLEARGGGELDFDLAYHYDAADEPARALPHAVVAAERAHARHDMALAERYFRSAARALGGDAGEAGDAGDAAVRYRVARGLGDVLLARSSYDECERMLDEADRLAGDPTARAEIEERRAELALKRGDLRAAAGHGERALRLIGRRVPSGRIGCALIVLGQLAVQALHTTLPRLFVGKRRPDRAGDAMLAIRLYQGLTAPYFFARGAIWSLWAHLRDLNLSERYGPSAALGRAYGLHGAMCSGFPRFLERAVRYARRGAALCEERGDLVGQARAVQFLSAGLCTAGRYRESVAAAEESARLFERAGDTWQASGPLCWGALARYRQGDLAGALDAARGLFDRAGAIDDAHGLAFAIDVWGLATDGRAPTDAVERELVRRAEHVQTTSLVAQADAVRLLATGKAAEAEFLIDTWLRRMRDRGALLQEPSASLLAYRVAALRRQAEEVPATAPRRRARLVARARRASRRALRVGSKYHNSEPHALREAALIAAMSGRAARALELIERSIERSAELGARYELALSREARASLHVALERPGGDRELDSARAELAAMRAPLAEPVRATVSLVERFRSALSAGRRIARALSVGDVYEALRAGALALLTARRCSILEPPGADRAGGAPDSRAEGDAHGGADGRGPEARVVAGDADPVGLAMVAEAIETRRVVVRPTAGRPIGEDPTLARASVRSALCAPVVARGRVAALVWATHSDVGDAFGGEAAQIAEFLTALAGAALENVEGLRQVQEASRDLEARVEARTAELARASAELAAKMQQLEDTQQQLLHAGRMATVGTLIAGLSHELNNPLTVIAGNIEHLVRLTPEEDEQQRRMVEAIDRQARRAARLVRALLRFSRTQPDEREWVQPGDLVRTAADLVAAEARRRDVQLRLSVTEPLPAISITQHDIESALVNLATNALQATPPRGRVDLEVSAESRAGVPGIAFTVRDTGAGIGADLLPQIFDPFFTTKPAGKGTGLGLSLARQAVTSHGGHIDAESSPGAGTTMRIWLPLDGSAPDDED